MPRLLVAPLSRLPDALREHAPSHLVSLLSPEHMIETPAGFPADRHLRLGVNDIADPAAGTDPPGPRPYRSRCWTSPAAGTPASPW